MKNTNARNRGFTLLIAVVLSAIAASITLALTTLAYKGLILSAAAQESQYAFYAADAALECAIYWDTGKDTSGAQNQKFLYSTTPPGSSSVACAGVTVPIAGSYSSGETTYVTNTGVTGGWFTIHTNQCARFKVYKTGSSAKIYAEGVNMPCTDLNNPRGVVRAIRAIY